jgi:hypothetical protein
MTFNPRRAASDMTLRLLRVFILLSATALTACSTQYGQTGLTGGFTDKMVSEDTGVIVVSGNGFTSPEKVESMLLLRASEMTMQSGHQRFSLLTIEDQAALDAQKAGRLPAYLREKAARDAPKPKLLTEQTTISNRYLTTTVNKSGGGFFVVMYKGSKGGAHDASKLVAELRPKLQAAAAEQPAPAAATITQ